jgi:hypothetical protein
MKRRKKKPSNRISKRFANVLKEHHPVETDFNYWAMHALHWNALLFAVIGFFVVGRTVFHQ